MSATPSPLTLRQLPLPVKLVVSVFLISVGLGYFSALVQLHFQHASPGNPMPQVADVVARFSGVTWPIPAEVKREVPRSHLQRLLEAPESEPWNGTGSMAKAFTTKSTDWDKDEEQTLRPQRDGERLTLIAWLKAGAPQEAYDKDAFPLAADAKAITGDYLNDDKTVKIQTIINDRCVYCHGAGGDQERYSFETFPAISKYTKVKTGFPSDPAKGKQLSVEKLTQSTHAHMLSFSMLFALTGLVFALSSYPVWFRIGLAPLALIAQIADISCWWLARLEGVGPYFAMAIMGTGGVVGLSVMLQITLSLFNLYDLKGKLVVLLLFIVGALGFGVLAKTVILPTLAAEKIEMDATNAIEAGVEKGQ